MGAITTNTISAIIPTPIPAPPKFTIIGYEKMRYITVVLYLVYGYIYTKYH